MTEYISRRQRVRVERYCLGYTWKNDPGAGFSFECDKEGNLDRESKNPAALANYEYCLAHPEELTFRGVEDWSYHYTEPDVIRCVCGEKVQLHGFTNTCDRCVRDYNMSGQLLAPRSQWGEETGESLSDILNIGPDADGIWHDDDPYA